MEEQKPPIDLEVYVKKLVNCRRKVVVVNSVLNNAHVSKSVCPFCFVLKSLKAKSMLTLE